MSSFQTNVSLLVHQLREVVDKQKMIHEQKKTNEILEALEKQVKIIRERNSSEFHTTYNIGSLKKLFALQLSIIKQQNEKIIKLEKNLKH